MRERTRGLGVVLPGVLVLALAMITTFAPAPARTGPNFILALDPGHTPDKPGAISARGRIEREFNQDLAADITAALAQEPGLTVLLTNDRDESISNRGRAELANQARADLFLAIHHDSVLEIFLETWERDGQTLEYCDQFDGYSIFVSSPASPGITFARALADRLNQAGFHPTAYHAMDVPGERMTLLEPDRGIYLHSKRLTVLTETSMPAVLLEAGFIKNRDEELLLLDPDRRAKMADAVRLAVRDYRGPGPR